MKTTLLRLLSGVLGLCAALVAIVGPVLFIANERQEAKSAHQYNGHASFWGVVGGSATVLFLVLFLAFVAYFLLRFCFKGPKSSRVAPPSAAPRPAGQQQ
ncbi:MAG: hypothetical protein ABSD75_33435 [Terriglobales bacterium]|jgi:uncharacterized membrane protein